MNYPDFLQRHQSLFIGHAGKVTEADIIALAVYELKQLFHLNSMDIRLVDSYWSICTDVDWIAHLVGEDTQNYFNGLVTHPFCHNATFVLGGMLNLHATHVASFKNGVCDWYKGGEVLPYAGQYMGWLKQQARVIVFSGDQFALKTTPSS